MDFFYVQSEVKESIDKKMKDIKFSTIRFVFVEVNPMEAAQSGVVSTIIKQFMKKVCNRC